MSNKAPGKESFVVNPPIGTLSLLDTLRERLSRKVEENGGSVKKLADRGAVIRWLADSAEELLNGAEEITRERLSLETARATLEQERIALDSDRLTVEQASQEVARHVKLSREALDLITGLMAEGYTESQVFRSLRAIREAQIEPLELADTLAEAGGLMALVVQLEAARQEAQRIKTGLLEEVAALKMARGELSTQAQELSAEVEARSIAIQRADRQIASLQATAQDLGIYLPAIANYGAARIEDLPKAQARVLAGIILTAAVEGGGDEAFQIPPGPNRLMGGEARLSEIPGWLAPREAYQELRKAQVRREVRAEVHVEEGEE